MARILIVEDNMIIAMDMKERLESHGFEIPAIAQNGEMAVRLAKEVRPDLILMDIGLGSGIDGIQAALQIRSAQDTRVIFLTGNSHLLSKHEMFLDKPFDEEELLELIHTTISR
jgi:DNA-binding response OmpR family regulator